jgi:hypothetical protein
MPSVRWSLVGLAVLAVAMVACGWQGPGTIRLKAA